MLRRNWSHYLWPKAMRNACCNHAGLLAHPRGAPEGDTPADPLKTLRTCPRYTAKRRRLMGARSKLSSEEAGPLRSRVLAEMMASGAYRWCARPRCSRPRADPPGGGRHTAGRSAWGERTAACEALGADLSSIRLPTGLCDGPASHRSAAVEAGVLSFECPQPPGYPQLMSVCLLRLFEKPCTLKSPVRSVLIGVIIMDSSAPPLNAGRN
jgi:hypothetical protein